MFTFAELQKKDLKALHEELAKARIEYAKGKIPVKMRQDKKTHVVHNLKIYIAQILTLINHAQ